MKQLKIRGTGKTKDPFKITEHELMNWCISRLSLANFYVWRNNAGRIPIRSTTGAIQRMIIIGKKGVGDIIGISSTGKFCNFEIKVGYNKLSPAQESFGEEVTLRGGIHRVFYTTEECDLFCQSYAKEL